MAYDCKHLNNAEAKALAGENSEEVQFVGIAAHTMALCK